MSVSYLGRVLIVTCTAGAALNVNGCGGRTDDTTNDRGQVRTDAATTAPPEAGVATDVTTVESESSDEPDASITPSRLDAGDSSAVVSDTDSVASDSGTDEESDSEASFDAGPEGVNTESLEESDVRADAATPVTLDASSPPLPDAGSRHALCAEPFPAVPPELPEVQRNAEGRPAFDEWRDLACADAGNDLCTEGTNTGLCFKGTPDAEQGVLTMWDIDLWCDGEGPVTGYNGQCWMCMPVEDHAAACCAGLEGFDCRAWPFPADGKPGTVCARHEDCEPGLVCGTAEGEGYGICQCPGLAQVEPSEACGYPWD